MKSDEIWWKGSFIRFSSDFIRFHFFLFFLFFNFHDFYPISAISVKISFLKQWLQMPFVKAFQKNTPHESMANDWQNKIKTNVHA